MDGLAVITATTGGTTTAVNPSVIRSLIPSFSPTRRRRRTRNLSFPRKPKFVVFSSKEEPKLDRWDQIELKFGQLLGEDPKLTLAKIMGKKSNPDMSHLEIEKSFYTKKGKSTEEVPFGGSEEEQLSNSRNGLNLVRPVPKKGVKFEGKKMPQVKKPSQPVGKTVDNTKGGIPNVILRRPTTFNDEDVGTEKSSNLRIKPNLLLRMGKEQTKERFSDITLLKKPQPSCVNSNLDKTQEHSGDAKPKVIEQIEDNSLETEFVLTKATNDVTLLNKPEQRDLDSNVNQEKESSDDHIGLRSDDAFKDNTSFKGVNSSIETVNTTKRKFDESLETQNASPSGDGMLQDDSATGLQPLELSDIGPAEKSTAINELSGTKLEDSNAKLSIEAALQGKPKRLDQSVKGTSKFGREDTVLVIPESYGNAVELENFLATSPIKEHEDIDWTRAEDLVKTGGREEVELISSSTRGFVVSLGSLVGFLPYRNLTARWKFLAFESWLRRQGLSPSMYKQNLGIIGSYEVMNKTSSLESSLVPEMDQKVEGEISPDMKLEDLLRIYDQEKLKFLSSFVGQKIKLMVVLADRKSRRLIFSIKPKEKEELVEKKRSLMARLSVGDVVKCCIKKIMYFGIFVEVEGVPALIHQSEVTWDATLDPASYFKVGQIVEAKVHQLDFSLERIFLSLKEITPDPLGEALEAVIGDHDSLDGKLEAAEADAEWADVESLVKELQRFEGIQSVSKGRFFLSPGLAPTFQVYMASMFENQYKLLARSENRVQEVIVQTSLGKEEMKSAILTCTNRVE
ncbi:hypothetical protein F0562_013257 [Nyssa sinensis]|uniref:S1 motif domain-containing protein n=1 Tax=Nyssa sinensis TaxID=561372 RepID=A0A5J4ZY62_9ASTE|nr:hypothetical protein F0562_013257 [Nyssa sinensis]